MYAFLIIYYMSQACCNILLLFHEVMGEGVAIFKKISVMTLNMSLKHVKDSHFYFTMRMCSILPLPVITFPRKRSHLIMWVSGTSHHCKQEADCPVAAVT